MYRPDFRVIIMFAHDGIFSGMFFANPVKTQDWRMAHDE
jgi:hypothetical protein